ncbi:GNAT family N-acetyltransferase [Maritalea myrionectae]|uniref:GNAT family N-acetyltransferase n=1 Tax=Maritalea myrionectae TaxID=454601 RepID=UPI0003FA7C92|nr:GNAT family N-acetyltransferase [Maritalea myrionectae]
MSDHNLTFRVPTKADAEQITQIHEMGLGTGHASFREVAMVWSEFENNYLTDRSVAGVICSPEGVLGWATIVQSSARPVYAGVGEISIYLDRAAQGRGIGKRLMRDIIDAAEAKGYWTLFGHIFPENTASIALHDKMGFDVIGRRRAIGKMTYGPMAGKWRDVLLMERRSTRIGVD